LATNRLVIVVAKADNMVLQSGSATPHCVFHSDADVIDLLKQEALDKIAKDKEKEKKQGNAAAQQDSKTNADKPAEEPRKSTPEEEAAKARAKELHSGRRTASRLFTLALVDRYMLLFAVIGSLVAAAGDILFNTEFGYIVDSAYTGSYDAIDHDANMLVHCLH
jgi:hypothetical protein